MNRWMLVCVVAATGCASGGAQESTAPDRALFRLRTSGVEPTADAVVLDDDLEISAASSGPLVAAYTASFRFLRGDGAALTSPRITAYVGQRANITILNQTSFIQDFDVERKDDAWIADPVIGMLQSGMFVEMTVLDVEGRPGEAVLAFSMKTADVRKPIATRTIGSLSPGFPQPVTIQMPRIESAEVLGARRVVLGQEFEIARLPDPSGAGENILRGTVVRVMVPGPASNESFVPADTGIDDLDAARSARLATLRALGAAAVGGAATGTLRVTAIRMPAGAENPESRGVERLATLSVDSVLRPGASVSNRLGEAYLADWEIDTGRDGTGAECVCDPVIGMHDSGLTVTVAEGAALDVQWRTTPYFEQSTFAPFDRTGSLTNAPPARHPGFRLAIDTPHSTASERRIPLTRGRSVHPVFRLPDGGTAALVVEYEPAQ